MKRNKDGTEIYISEEEVKLVELEVRIEKLEKDINSHYHDGNTVVYVLNDFPNIRIEETKEQPDEENRPYVLGYDALSEKYIKLYEGDRLQGIRFKKIVAKQEQPSRDDKIRELFDGFIHSIKPNLTEHSMELIEKIYVLLGE